VRGIQHDSEELLFWDELSRIHCPALIVRGGQRDSLVTDEDVDRYRRCLPHFQLALLPKAGHDLSQPEPGRFIDVLQTFLQEGDVTHTRRKPG
jgi:pimeloyl-ACP methyl ester carboxylesterase